MVFKYFKIINVFACGEKSQEAQGSEQLELFRKYQLTQVSIKMNTSKHTFSKMLLKNEFSIFLPQNTTFSKYKFKNSSLKKHIFQIPFQKIHF